MFSLCCWAPERKLPIYFISNKLMLKIQEFMMEFLRKFLGHRSNVEHVSRQRRDSLSVHPALVRNLYAPLYYTKPLKYKVILVCI